MAPSPCIQALLTAAGDGSLGRAQTPLHGVLWRGERQGGKSFLLCPGGTAGSEPTRSSPGLPPPALPPWPEPQPWGGSRLPRGAVRSDGAAPRGSAREQRPGSPSTSGQQERPSRGPASPPTPGAAGLLSGDPTFSRPSPKGLQSSPTRFHTAAAPDRDLGTPGEQGGRPALTAAATSCGPQHPSSSTRQPAARLKLLRRGSIPPAQELRGRPCGAGIARRGSAAPCRQLAPAAPTPAPAPLPHSPASPGSSPPGTTVFLRSGGGWGGRCRARCCCCYRPSPLRGGHSPPPFPQAPRLCRLQERAPPLPAPHLHRAGSWTPGLFFAAEVAGVGGCRGSCCQCQVAPLEGRVAGVGLAWLSLGLSGPAQVRRLGGQRKLPAWARCECLEGLRCLPDPERAAPAVPARLYRGAARPGCSAVPGEGAPAAGAPCPAPSDGGPSSSSGCAVPRGLPGPWHGQGECRARPRRSALPPAPP